MALFFRADGTILPAYAAVLEYIIHTEEAKPVANQDTDLIDNCIREIAEIKGVKSEFTYEEITEIKAKLVDTVNGTTSEKSKLTG